MTSSSIQQAQRHFFLLLMGAGAAVPPILQMWKAELRKAYMVPKFMQGRGGGSEFNSSLLISVSLCFLDFR